MKYEYELSKTQFKNETVYYKKNLNPPQELIYEFSTDENGNKFISPRIVNHPFWLNEFEQMAYSQDEFDKIGYDEVKKLLGEK